MGENLESWLISLNVSQNAALIIIEIIYLLAITLLCFLVYIVTKNILVNIFKRISAKTLNKWDDAFVESKSIENSLKILPAVIFYYLTFLLPLTQTFVILLLDIYIALMVSFAINSFLNAVGLIYNRKNTISRKRPIKGFLTAVKTVAFIMAAVIIFSRLMNQSPIYILSGLGALSAVTMLIFKDSILGMVAGFMMASNDLVRIGDWIEMPKYGADGDVIDISLTIVKVQNFDRTITTIPSYALVSDSFKNWRGMQASGGRRIKRSIFIDMTSITFCSDELLGKLSEIEYLKKYLKERQEEINNYNKENNLNTKMPVNGRRMTNIGIFRKYIYEYLVNNPKIHKEMIVMVRQLASGNDGVPLEIYAFTNNTAWVAYEEITSDIFDHLLAIVSYFELKIFQEPSGSDIRSLKQ